MLKKITILSITLFVVACGRAQQETDTDKIQEAQAELIQNAHRVAASQAANSIPDRFTLVRVKTVDDGIAYDGQRGIYILVDNQTGQQYVGVSGVGISELGSHQAGKTQHTDER